MFPLTLSSLFPTLLYFRGQTLATGDSALLITPESTAHLVLGCKATAHLEGGEKNGGWEDCKNKLGWKGVGVWSLFEFYYIQISMFPHHFNLYFTPVSLRFDIATFIYCEVRSPAGHIQCGAEPSRGLNSCWPSRPYCPLTGHMSATLDLFHLYTAFSLTLQIIQL